MTFHKNIIHHNNRSYRITFEINLLSIKILFYWFNKFRKFNNWFTNESILTLRWMACFFIDRDFNIRTNKLIKFIFPVQVQMISKKSFSNECLSSLIWFENHKFTTLLFIWSWTLIQNHCHAIDFYNEVRMILYWIEHLLFLVCINCTWSVLYSGNGALVIL